MIQAMVINRLLRWQRWRLDIGNALGYPGTVSFMRLVPSSTHFPDPGMEADCVITQKAYEMLSIIHQGVLWVEYLSTVVRQEEKARAFGRTRKTYVECLNEAYYIIGNTIELLQEKRKEVA